jgi:hypothetical protein
LHGKTGFLYQPGSMEDLLTQFRTVLEGGERLKQIRRAAREMVVDNFDSRTNRARFATTFLSRIDLQSRDGTHVAQEQAHENPVLQQI